MTLRRVTVGTRGSELAVLQAKPLVEHLEALGWEVAWTRYTTSGDRWLKGPLDERRGTGFFTKELEEDLRSGTLDLAIHSLKDVAVQRPAGLATACVPRREDPSDWLVLRMDAPDAPRIGTGAVRRERLLAPALPGATFTWIRGNVPTRLQRVREGELRGEPLHGTLLAAAGLRRLGLSLEGLRVRPLGPDELLPAPGQGALIAECRAGASELQEALAGLHHEESARCVALERAVLQGLGGGCQMPLGVLAEARPEGGFRLRAAYAPGGELRRAEGSGDFEAARDQVLVQLRGADAS